MSPEKGVQSPKSKVQGPGHGEKVQKAPERILVIQLRRLGDVLLTTPVIELLRQVFPQAQIDVLVETQFAHALRGNPSISNVRLLRAGLVGRIQDLMSLRQEKYDWVIDFLSNGASAWACLFSGAPQRVAFESAYPAVIHNRRFSRPKEKLYSPLVKINLVRQAVSMTGAQANDLKEALPKIFVSEDRILSWRSVAQSCGYQKGRLIFLSPSSRQSSRRWKKEYFSQLAQMLARETAGHIVILWGPGERELAQEIARQSDHERVRLAPRLKRVTDLAAFLSQGDLLVTNCNGTKHVAVAMNVPTLTIHTSSDPVAWNPPPANGSHGRFPVIRQDDLWCIGCQKNQCPYQMECASMLKPKVVFERALTLWKKSNETTLA